MKITKKELNDIIKEEIKHILIEQHFDPATGEPITAKGMDMVDKMIDQAIEAEKKCFAWAKDLPEMRQILIKHYKSGDMKTLPVEVLKKCPHKANEEAHRRLNVVMNRVNREMRGQAPADDDTSQIAKVRRRLHRQKQGLPPADDDTSQIAKVRRRLHAKGIKEELK